jgi:hypothetical protein
LVLEAAPALQLAVGTSVVTTGEGQLVVVQELLEVAVAAVQVVTGTLLVLFVLQLVQV